MVSSPTVTDERHSRKPGAIGALSERTNTLACMRSIGVAEVTSDTPMKASTLSPRLQNTPWVSGSALMPNNACGRSS